MGTFHLFVVAFQITLEKLSSAFCNIVNCSSLYCGFTQLHPLSSNPNEWQLHLSMQGSTSVHPTLGIVIVYIQEFTSQLCSLHVSSWPSIQKKNSSTNFAGWLFGFSVVLQSLLSSASIFGTKCDYI